MQELKILTHSGKAVTAFQLLTNLNFAEGMESGGRKMVCSWLRLPCFSPLQYFQVKADSIPATVVLLPAAIPGEVDKQPQETGSQHSIIAQIKHQLVQELGCYCE